MSSSEQDFWLAELGGARNFNRWVFDSIAPHLKGPILEVGCGTGTFTGLMLAAGHAVTAIDINPAYVASARSRFGKQANATFIAGDAARMTWTSPFATIVALDVVEHIEDDAGFLRHLGTFLEPGGRVVVKLPAGAWLYTPMDAAIGHFRRYTKKSLERAFAAAGLEIVAQRYFNAAGILGWWLNGRVLKRTVPPSEQIGLFERLVPVLRGLERIAAPIGLSLIAAGTRRVERSV